MVVEEPHMWWVVVETDENRTDREVYDRASKIAGFYE